MSPPCGNSCSEWVPPPKQDFSETRTSGLQVAGPASGCLGLACPWSMRSSRGDKWLEDGDPID